MQKDTVSIYFVRAALRHLCGADRDEILRISGISLELLNVAQTRVPATAFAIVWMSVARCLDDEFFGLDRRSMKVGSFALLCHAILSNDNLEQALKHMLSGFALLLDDISATVHLEDGKAIIRITNHIVDVDDRRFANETFLVMVHGLMCWLVGKRIALTRAEFTGKRPDYAQEYAVLFSSQLEFDAQETAIYFDGRMLDTPIVQNKTTLGIFLRNAPQSVFLKYKNKFSWTSRLRNRLRGCIGAPDWPLLEELAQEFGVASTTMRRKLIAEGTSYQTIKDDMRRDAAIHYLCTTRMSIGKISELLCFQDVSAFRRAFKSWSGVQPSYYRA
jgi:AraC-like DNA-binding protein